MTRAPLKEEAEAGLELISIGSLYSGPWDKKYWSCSRGKERYPYPVGYQAVRAYNGIRYKMEIHEGPKGPLFLIMSMDGHSFSGQTPDIAWEMSQRKSCLHMKIWHGKRASCKVDGVEFFGFKNPFIQRLLRELVANVSGSTELNLLPSNLCNKSSGSSLEHHSTDECENADSPSCLDRPDCTGRRSRRNAIEMEKRPFGANLKKIRRQGPKNNSVTSKPSSSVSANEGKQSFSDKHEGNRCQENSLTFTENNDISNVPATFSGSVPITCIERHMHAQEEDTVSENSKPIQVAHNLSIEPHGRLPMDELEDSHQEMDIDANRKDAPFPEDCPEVEDNHHRSSDTSATFESAPVIMENNILNQIEKLKPSDIVVSEGLPMESFMEEMCLLNENSSSGKNDFDSVGEDTGQDMVKSMMTFLLPQAIPLLDKTSGKKKASISTLETLPCDVNAADALSMEKGDRERQEKMDTQHVDCESITPCFELSKCVVLDSLEDEQYCGHPNTNGELLSIADVGQANVKEAQNANDSNVRSISMHSEPLKKEIVSKEDVAKNDVLPSSQAPNMVYRRRKAQNVSQLTKESSCPLFENDISCCFEKQFGAKTSPTTKSLNTSSIDIMSFLPENQLRKDLVSEPIVEESPPGFCSEKTATNSEAGLEKLFPLSPTLDQGEALPRADKNEDNSGPLDEIVQEEQFAASVDKEMIEQSNLLRTYSYNLSHEMGTNFKDNCMNSHPHCNLELYSEAEGMSKIVGCYLHPMPVLSVFLRNIDNVIYICVLCGFLVDKNGRLFTYRVEMKESRLGYPSFDGHTTVTLPVLKDYLDKEIVVEQTGFQFSPDGNYLVLMGSIKTPFCRTGNINCSCSTCTTNKFEEDELKIVQVQYGYVSTIASLKSADCVHCVLTCEPDHLVAVGRGGRLHLWVMDSTWSKQTDSYSIPSEDCMSPNLVEIKKIPQCADLIVGHNGVGEFSLWDISKRAMVLRFFSSSTSVNQFLPISLFDWKRREIFIRKYGSREHVNELQDATNTSSENSGECESLQLKDIALWLFISTESDSDVSDSYSPINCQNNQATMWKLALLANSMVTFGPDLDSRASAIGASAGRGIIGTHDGLVYVWELSTGNKLGNLLRCKGRSVSCIATDNTETGVMAVAADGRLLVYQLSSVEKG